MKDLRIVIIEIIIGFVALLTITIYQNIELKKENKELKAENIELQEENIDYVKLKKENIELWKQNTEYKWQLEQTPYIIESSLDSWCNRE